MKEPFNFSRKFGQLFTHSLDETVVYISGGIRAKNNEVLNEFYDCNVFLNNLVPRKPMPEARYAHAASCIQEYIVITGGVKTMMHNMGLRSVPVGESKCFAMHLQKLEWHALPEIPNARIYPTLINVANRHLFQIGGFEDYYLDCYQLDID